jgi:hypothetical protein
MAHLTADGDYVLEEKKGGFPDFRAYYVVHSSVAY